MFMKNYPKILIVLLALSVIVNILERKILIECLQIAKESATNLKWDEFDIEVLKEFYHLRWGT